LCSQQHAMVLKDADHSKNINSQSLLKSTSRSLICGAIPMRNVLIYLVLIIHINTTMFFPVVEETVRYDMKGKPVDDVTSVVEFVDQVLLEHKDDTPCDREEDNREHFFSAFKCGFYLSPQQILYTQKQTFEPEPVIEYSETRQNAVSIVSYDILTPPPKA